MSKYSTLHKKVQKMQNDGTSKIAPSVAFINTTKGECNLCIGFWDGKLNSGVCINTLKGHFANYDEAINCINYVSLIFPPTSTGMVIFVGEDDLLD